jgi:hypothetical protein
MGATSQASNWDETLSAVVADADSRIHHGRPGLPALDKRRWAARLASVLPADQAEARLCEAARHARPAVRAVAAAVMAGLPVAPWAERLVDELARDADWEVREWAVGPLAAWAGADGDGGGRRLSRWMARPGGPRRAALLAMRQLVLQGCLSVPQALILIRPAFDDPDPLMVETVGSFVIGDGCLRRDPVATVGWLESMAEAGFTEVHSRHIGRILRSRAAAQHRAALTPLARAAMEPASPSTRRAIARWLSRAPATDTP